MMSIMFMGGTVVLRMGHETHKGSFSIKDQRIILNFDDGANWQFDYQLENENNLLVLDGKYRLSRYHTPEPSVTTTEREKRAINDLADREQVNYSQALNAALIATRDFAVGFCSRALTPEEKAFKAQGLNDPKVAALAAKLLDIMNNMCIYSRENWCSQYGSGQSPFVL